MVRKMLSYGLAVLLVVSFLPSFIAQAAAPSYSLAISNDKPSKGDQIEVAVKGQHLNDVYGYEINLDYDASRLIYVDMKSDIKGFSVPIVDEAGGHIKFAHTKTGATPGDDGDVTFVTVTFKAKETGKASIEFKDVKLVDSQMASKVETAGVKSVVDVAGTNSGGGGGGGGDTGGNTGTSVTVTADQLSHAVQGKVTIDLPAGTTELKLPSNASELLSSNKFVVHTDGFSLEIPSAVFKQLAEKMSTADLKDSVITLKLAPLSTADANALIAKTEKSSYAAIKLAGQVVDFGLSMTSAGGKTVSLTQFDQPMMIRFKADANFNSPKTGVFNISDGGALEYVGGVYGNGEMTASINHFSKYAALEVTKAFVDVPAKFWAYNAIVELAAKQIVNGTSPSTYEPNRLVTRAEFATLLVNALKLTKEAPIKFVDVPTNAWYAKSVAIAFQAGIVKGKSPTTFDPNGKITREEMVTMLMQAYEVKTGKKLGQYTDSPFKDMNSVSSWAANYVKAAADLKLVNGRAPGQFAPKGVTTRAEAAQVIYNLVK
ncbi:hypothetical protein D7Z26_11465 [Cohnella endophytica]|uniref:SLH domain-containing protein n=1 Tax=Cohnella endophytica TaxID=2419778 RepID=A0A494XTP4_9BACL|nr:S-layer homology domain-containing protein [Cohnella endophytica]RKP54001.1 hypothetical protein D7Z26_11465 [Cohnella endophytica]